MEARSGIEPLLTALQAAASPLCHRAKLFYVKVKFYNLTKFLFLQYYQLIRHIFFKYHQKLFKVYNVNKNYIFFSTKFKNNLFNFIRILYINFILKQIVILIIVMEFETARKNMVLSQLKPNKVTDEKVLDAFLQVPREIFVKKAQSKHCYIDENLMINKKRYLLNPLVLARINTVFRIK